MASFCSSLLRNFRFGAGGPLRCGLGSGCTVRLYPRSDAAAVAGILSLPRGDEDLPSRNCFKILILLLYKYSKILIFLNIGYPKLRICLFHREKKLSSFFKKNIGEMFLYFFDNFELEIRVGVSK